MPQSEQYEVWSQKHGQWEMALTLFNLKTASDIISRYPSPMRLVRATYDGGKLTRKDVLAEIGGTRQQP